MSPLDRKLAREVVRMRGQVFTIALVVASGIATLVGMQSTFVSLHRSQQQYYAESRFADVFASVRRAPVSLEQDLRAIRGVASLELRVVEDVMLDMPGMAEPVAGRLVSMPSHGPPSLHRLHVRRGRALDPARPGEVLVSEAFANAHHLQPGSTVTALINGRRLPLRVAGVALSPEYLWALRAGDIVPDDRRFGVFWMDIRALSSAYGLTGAFNDVILSLTPRAPRNSVLAEVDRILEPYGTPGSYGRDRQLSDRYVSQELMQLSTYAWNLPILFLSVAAFLVNVVLARMIASQREQLAALKALGYTNFEVGWHYAKFAILVVVIGTLLGTALGAWMGQWMTGLYTQYFRFPVLAYRLSPQPVAAGFLVSLGTSLVGAWSVVRRASRLPPAEAMRPEPPPSFKPTLLERLGFHRLFSHAARMVLRDMQRRPWRTFLAIIGISFSAAICVAGRFSLDAVDYLMAVQFRAAQREDMTVILQRPGTERARHVLAALPGVLEAESMRTAGVRLHNGRYAREVAVFGLRPDAQLHRVFDQRVRQLVPSREGLALSRPLAERLHLHTGEPLEAEILDGAHRRVATRVIEVVEDFLGMSAYMHIDGLRRLLRETDGVTEIALSIDHRHEEAILDRIKRMPGVAGVTRHDNLIRYFRE